ncbi:MAG TPA: hypothetical protein VIJ95_07055 [Hanamia sp.]
MTPTEALITTARRYCMDNHSYWANRYSNEMSHNNNPYSDNDYNLFPRYNALAAILLGVETFVGQTSTSIDNCKQELKQTGLTSQTPFTTGRQNDIERNAIQDERNKFAKFIDSITDSDLELVEALPHRRKLKDEEAKQIRKQLLDTWNYDGSYWEPLENRSTKPTVFLMKEIVTKEDIEKIIQIVSEKADKNIFEVSEDRNDYEIEIDSFSPDLYETICCDKSFDWVVYGSHESTIAFGGTWLIEKIGDIFSDRKEKLNLWEQNW